MFLGMGHHQRPVTGQWRPRCWLSCHGGCIADACSGCGVDVNNYMMSKVRVSPYSVVKLFTYNVSCFLKQTPASDCLSFLRTNLAYPLSSAQSSQFPRGPDVQALQYKTQATQAQLEAQQEVEHRKRLEAEARAVAQARLTANPAVSAVLLTQCHPLHLLITHPKCCMCCLLQQHSAMTHCACVVKPPA